MTEDIRPGCLPDCIEFGFTLPCPKCDQRKTAMVNEARHAIDDSLPCGHKAKFFDPSNAAANDCFMCDLDALREELRKAQARIALLEAEARELFKLAQDAGARMVGAEAELRKAREEHRADCDHLCEHDAACQYAREAAGKSDDPVGPPLTLETLAALEGEDVAGFLMKRGYSKWETERREARAGAFAEAAKIVQDEADLAKPGWGVQHRLAAALRAHDEHEAAGKSEGAQAITTITLCHVCGQTETICRAAALHTFEPVEVQQ